MIVVLGATGYVGSKFTERLRARDLAHRGLSRPEVDYTRAEPLRAFLQKLGPEFLVNAAGYTGKPNVDAAESDRAACLAGNAVLPGTVAAVCADLDLPWGQVASGCIYDGCRADGGGFTESDPPNFSFRQDNCSWYSGTKALGEEVLSGAPNCFQWRLRIPFNHEDNPRNYLSKLRTYARLVDVTNTISHLDEFVDTCIGTWTERVPYGTYNLVNPGAISTREVMERLQAAGLAPPGIHWFESEATFRAAVRTPRSNCLLDASKIADAGLPMRPVREALDHAIAHWRAA